MKKFNGKSNCIGALIKEIRIEKGMSAYEYEVCKQLQYLNIHINTTELYKIEKGKMMVKDFEMVALSIVLEIDFENIKSYLKGRLN